LSLAPQVTVLIPFYNPGRYLIEAIESVLQQTYMSWQLILIDDASTDNSASLIRKYLRDPRIRLLRNKQNRGQSHSMNRGLAQVNTPYVVQLDADDWFYPYTLAVLVREMNQQPADVAVVSGNLGVVYQDASGRTVRTAVWKNRAYHSRYQFLRASRSVWPRFYRTRALRRVGGWPTDDPYRGRYVEDIAILSRLIEHYRFHYVNRVLYKHRKHTHNMTKQGHKVGATYEWIIRNRLKRWGNRYRPVFKTYASGIKTLAKLVPTRQK